MSVVHQVVVESVAGCSHHPVEHLFRDGGALGIGDEEESRLGCRSVREAVTDNLQLLAALHDDDPADIGRWWFDLG